MILSFKEQFKKPILLGKKIHSIREDKTDRWKAGTYIHLATGVRTKNYDCFEELTCKHVQKIKIKYNVKKKDTIITFVINDKHIGNVVLKNCKVHSVSKKIHELSINDGFKDVNDFLEWFSEDFTGKIIHWTSKRY